MITVKIAAEYALTVIKKDKSVVSRQVPNLITDLGLNSIGTSTTNSFGFCQLGNGIDTPNAADVALKTFLKSAAMDINGRTVFSVVTIEKYLMITKFEYTFPVAIEEYRFTELGIGATSNAMLFSRAVIKDDLGQTVEFVVLPGESLKIAYSITTTIPNDVIANFNYRGIDTSIILRSAKATDLSKWDITTPNFISSACFSYNGDIRGRESFPLGSTLTPATYIYKSAYVPDSFELVFRVSFANDAIMADGIHSILLDSNEPRAFGCYQLSFFPPLEKDIYHAVKITFKVSWLRG